MCIRDSAYTCTEFAGATPAEGNIFLVADVTVHNTGSSSVEMYDTENLADLPVLSDEQLPSTYTLGVDEERLSLIHI